MPSEVDEEDDVASVDHYRKEFYLHCDYTDLHGWQYFTNLKDKSLVYRCMWGLVIFFSIVAASVILTYACLEYVMDAVQTTYDPSLGTVDELYFPTVTLCNINQIRRSFVSELELDDGQLTQIKRLLYFGSAEDMTDEEVAVVEEIATRKVVYLKGHYVTRVRRKTSSWSAFREEFRRDWDAINGTHVDSEKSFFHNIQRFAAQDLGEETILWASYRGEERNPGQTTLFYPFYPTDYGRCTLIHPMIAFDPKHENGTFEELRRNYVANTSQGVLYGRENGLTLLVDAETYDYAFAPQTGEGFKLAVTPYRDIPNMALNDIDVMPGTTSKISIIPTVTSTTNRCRSTLNPDRRLCYFQDEFQFANFENKGHRYSLSNCLQEAMETKAYEECGCDFFNRKGRKKARRDVYCTGRNLTCFREVRKKWGTFLNATDRDGVLKSCLPACNDQTHILTTTTSAFPNFNTFTQDQRDFCSLFLKLNSSCRHEYKSVHLEASYGPEFCLTVLNESYLFEKCSSWPQRYSVETEKASYDASAVSVELKDCMYMYARDNVAKVSIFFNDPVIKKVIRDLKLSLIMFLANIGGILGLAMGASIITLFEMLYHTGRLLSLCSWKILPKFRRSMVPNYP